MSVDRAEEAGAQAGGAPQAVAAVSGSRSYSVAPGVQLKVRSGPGTGYSVVRVLSGGSRIQILCQTSGTTVSGTYGTSSIWDCIGGDEYVSDAYVNTGSDGYVTSRCG